MAAHYGQLIRAMRNRIGLSQAKLAKSAKLPQALISAWELNKAEPAEEQYRRIVDIIAETEKQISAGALRLNEKKIVRSARSNRKIPPIPGPEVYAEFSRRHAPAPAGEPNRAYLEKLRELGRHVGGGRQAADKPRAIALFAGCGGFSLGFKAAGFDVVGHVEIDEYARRVYQANFPDSDCLGADITQIRNEDAENWTKTYGRIHVLFGGPPCQGFSLAGKRNPHDARNELFQDYLRIANIVQPDILVFENVRLMTSMKDPNGELFIARFTENLRQIGYDVAYKELNAQHYGVPQFRERVILIGVNRKSGIDALQFPEITHADEPQIDLFSQVEKLVTFRDAVADLPLLESGQASGDDPLHFAIDHPAHVIEWLKATPEGKSAHDNDDPKLRPPSGYNTTYKRIYWDEPCSTIGTNFNMISGCRNVHPANTRSFTIREAARCQSFPDNFIFFGPWPEVRRMIGNAVPPLFAKTVAEHVRFALTAGNPHL